MWSAFSLTIQNVIFLAGGHSLFLVITCQFPKYRQFLTHSASCPSHCVQRVAVHARTPASASRVHRQGHHDYSSDVKTTCASDSDAVQMLLRLPDCLSHSLSRDGHITFSMSTILALARHHILNLTYKTIACSLNRNIRLGPLTCNDDFRCEATLRMTVCHQL